MAGSTSKKVLVERFERESVSGFVAYPTFTLERGIEVITTSGNALLVPYTEVKSVHFVKDFAEGTLAAGDKVFAVRPKTAGLWVRLVFRDHDVLEGILPNDLLQLQSPGYTITPPGSTSNTQRVFVPRDALTELRVLGVIGSPLRQGKAKKPGDRGQIGLFE